MFLALLLGTEAAGLERSVWEMENAHLGDMVVRMSRYL